jgi:DNA-binding CsgD family transcriptional regulator
MPSLTSRERKAAEKIYHESLTDAERAICALLLHGYSTAEIAERTDRSEYTVSNHLRRVFDKFAVTSRAAILARFVELP